ncbi:MAG: response regulator [Fidelibacterota bacterium]
MEQKKILIIDDEEDIRKTLSLFLERRGYGVIEAGDVIDTIKYMNKETPQIIFLDIKLPGLDGIEILKMIKHYDQDIPVIMMSGYATEDMAKESLQLGAFDYVRKPFNMDRIDSILSMVEISKF